MISFHSRKARIGAMRGALLFLACGWNAHAEIALGPLATEPVCLEVTQDLAIVDVSVADSPSKKLLVIAEGWNDQYRVSRHHANGVLDKTFSPSWHSRRLRATQGLPDGRVLVISDSLSGDPSQSLFLLSASGQANPFFYVENEMIGGIAIGPLQRVYLYGVPSGESGGALWRLNEDGSADKSFARVETPAPIWNVAFSDSAIFVQGQFGLAKFTLNGSSAAGFLSEAGAETFGLWAHGAYVFTATRTALTIPSRYRLQRFAADTGRLSAGFPEILFVPPVTHLDSAGKFYALSANSPYPLRRYQLPEGASDPSYSGALATGNSKIIAENDDTLLFLLAASVAQADTNLNGLDVTCDRYPARAEGQAPSRNLGRVFLDASRAPAVFGADRTGTRQAPWMLFETALGGPIVLGRSGDLDQPLTVRYALRSGTAGPQDHGGTFGELTFDTGVQSRTISLGVRDDDEPEPLEYFYVDIFSLDGELLTSIPVRIASNDVGIAIERRRAMSDPWRWLVPAHTGQNAGAGIYSSETLETWEPLPFEFYTYGSNPTGLRFFMFDSSVGTRFYRAK